MRRTLMIAALLPVMALGSGAVSTGDGYQAMDQHAEPLRSAFNADSGKVRVLMLVAPT